MPNREQVRAYLAGWRGLLILFLLLNLAALLAVNILPPYTTSPNTLQAPGRGHWLGTNDIGQDVLVGLIVAMPNTVFVALAAAFLSMLISILMAAMATVGNDFLTGLVLRLVDILLVIPSILILILLAALLQPGMLGIIWLLALTTWRDDVRVLRSVFLRELTRENVHYARHMGAGWPACLAQHILPAVWPVLMGLYVQNVRQATMKAAGLAFLGLTDPRLISWGSMMQDAMEYLYSEAWLWLLLPPALCLSLFLYFVLFIGQSLERYSMAAPEDGT